MGQESELGRLEQFVDKLLKRFNDLRDENAKLQQDLQERDGIIENLRGNIASQQSERGEISERLGKIVAQIEAWEQNLDATDKEEEEPVFEATSEEPEATVDVDTLDEPAGESAEDDEVDQELAEEVLPEAAESEELAEVETTVEDERRMQHNLFSMPQNKR